MTPLDKALLAECEHARVQMQAAESALKTARSGFEGAVRRLYIEGASTREIAEALDLSHQRVHQLVGTEPKSWWHRVLGIQQEPYRGCSFCGKSPKAVSKLVAGPSVHICDGCIKAAASLSDEEGMTLAAPFKKVPDTSPKRCSFCGQRSRGVARFTARGHQICSVCIVRAQEIVSHIAE